MTALLLSLACAAPAPPPVARIEAHHVAGEWRYAWGSMPDGRIALYPGGAYLSRHTPRHSGECPEWTHYGAWAVEGGDLVLRERSVAGGAGVAEYRVRLSAEKYPAEVRGEWGAGGGVPVALSDVVRFPEK